jgi:hypothetical protein
MYFPAIYPMPKVDSRWFCTYCLDQCNKKAPSRSGQVLD